MCPRRIRRQRAVASGLSGNGSIGRIRHCRQAPGKFADVLMEASEAGLGTGQRGRLPAAHLCPAQRARCRQQKDRKGEPEHGES
jgi:hypothetical protein